MNEQIRRLGWLASAGMAALGVLSACGNSDPASNSTGGAGGSSGTGTSGSSGKGGSATGGSPSATGGSSGKASLVDPSKYDGKEVFRFDTFGDEQFWTGQLRLNEAIQSALDPLTALSLGLKVDAAVLPDGILEQVPLDDAKTTVALIKMNAVIGVQGEVDASGELTSVGITCALCHTDVDDSVMPGIGNRLDGHANRSLDPGAIIALAPALADDEKVQKVLNSWGPGMYDARWNQDGISAPVQIPPIYGLAGVPLETYTGDGPVSYWNAYVAVTQMGGQGVFFDPRINTQVIYSDDQVTPKLPALYEYEISLAPPAVDPQSFNSAAAKRGAALFTGGARCSSCHSGPLFTDAAERLHAPAETGMEPVAAQRSATGMYRTTPLRALAQHPPYFHDASAKTLEDVVSHYDTALTLGLSAAQQADLVEYLKSL